MMSAAKCKCKPRSLALVQCGIVGIVISLNAQAAVVEYFNPDLNNFFITADPVEQAFVDTGAVGRWQRTGNAFATGGPNQVCRFYGNSNINPATGTFYGPNSHFYTADPAECAGLKAQYTPNAKSWKFESNDFLTTPAVNGACPAGLVPVYRAYNNGFARGIDSNHRITSNRAAYLQTVAAGSIGEGIVMCAPATIPAVRKSIVSISICKPGAGASGSCPGGNVDSLQAVMAPAAQGGGPINAYGGLFGLSDEHATILPPGTLPGHPNDYLILAASQTGLGRGEGPGLVVLTAGAGPDANGQWTLDFAHEYGLYKPANQAGAQNGQVFLSPMGLGNCPVVASATQMDPTFDLIYAAPGSVVSDPTNPANTGPGNLLMVYEGTNTCIGVSGPGDSGHFYSTLGVATSLDHGVNWPTYRSGWVPLPGQNTTQGPNAPAGALANNVCMGNDCAAMPPANYGRYAVLSQPVTTAAAIQAGQPLGHDMGNSEPSAFVDDVNVYGNTYYLYVASKFGTGPADLGGYHFDSTAATGGIAVARAALNGGSAPLQFMKWFGPAVSYANGTASGSFAQRIPPVLPPGVTCSAGTCPPYPDNRGLGSAGGGLESPIFPVDPNGGPHTPSYKTCQTPNQGQSMPVISYVEDTQQYLLTFVCLSPSDPATQSGGAGAAWFYSSLDAAQYDLSHQDKWSVPQQIIGSWSSYDSINQCGSGGFRYLSGWYPSLMSIGLPPGHLSTSGYVFFLTGCAGGGAGRQFSSRRFTITID